MEFWKNFNYVEEKDQEFMEENCCIFYYDTSLSITKDKSIIAAISP